MITALLRVEDLGEKKSNFKSKWVNFSIKRIENQDSKINQVELKQFVSLYILLLKTCIFSN